MDYFLSTMDHEVSQHCRIYQLEDVRIRAGESPNELMECLCALADHCNFPTNDEKECNVQYHFVHALSDKDLVKKLLALDLKATTALPRCWKPAGLTSPSVTTWMHWALLALSPIMQSIKGSTISNVNMEQNNLVTNTSMGIARNHIHLDNHHAQPRIQHATSVEKLDTGSQDAVEECPRGNSNPKKEQRKGKVEDQRQKHMEPLRCLLK